MNNKKYNQTCHINGEKISSVMLSACCAADVSSSSQQQLKSTSVVEDSQLAGMTIVSRVDSKFIGNYDGNYNRQQQQRQQVGNSSKRGTNLWSEKMGSSRDDTTSKNNKFASNPIRANSLFSNDPSLLSLYASDTIEDESNAQANRPTVSSSSGSSPATAHSVSQQGNRQNQGGRKLMNDNNDQTSHATPPNGTTQRAGGEGEYITPPRRISLTTTTLNNQQYNNNSSPTVPDSPGMELSMAKQAANMSSNNIRKNNRESFRHRYGSMDSSSTMDSPTKKARGGGGGGSSVASNSTATNRTPPQMPTKQQRGDHASNASIESVQKPHLEYENASPTPHWTTTTTKDINSELVNTYQYSRLYLYDPNQVISNGENLNNIISQQQQQPNNRYWWFYLAQRMGTTLKHVQDDHIKSLLFEQQQRQQQATSNGNGNSFFSQDSISAGESSSIHQQGTHANFGCMDTLDGSQEGGCVLSDLCISREQQQQKSGKSHRRYKSWSSNKSTFTGSFPAKAKPKLFTPTSTPINVWSEPLASTIKVRGGTYSQDGIKVESETSLFSVLGVDSFVNKDTSTNCSWGTQNYLQRWKKACCKNGMDQTPFLLIINFIVPWGNFQAYLIRPDADDGAFSTRCRHKPSEKAWRAFMQGNTEYRNQRLKLIPRVCDGPWMVKKMVGSTPALIGTKLPVTYNGSLSENYLEICLDVTKGPAFGNTVATTVVGKADLVTVDLGFVIEGQEEDGHLPEQILGLFRLHHLNMKVAPTHEAWRRSQR